MNKNLQQGTVASFGGLGRSRRRVLSVVGLLVGIAAAALLPILPVRSGHGLSAASAEIDPVGCSATIGSGSGFIQAVPNAVPVTAGSKITYTVGVGYPAPPTGVGCTAFTIHVGLQTPDGAWQDVCTIATLVSGAPTTLCSTTVDYTVTGTELDVPLLEGHVVGKGNKHDRTNDCIDPSINDFTSPATCWGAQQTSVLDYAAPTPTNTPANTATNTPRATATDEVIKSHTTVPTAVATGMPTGVPTGVPTVNVVLELAATPRGPTVAALPATGGGHTATGDDTRSVVALLSIAAGFALTLGVEAKRRQGRLTK